MAFSLDEKVIIVTGASSGIGRQCAIFCSELGAMVILIGRNPERLEDTLSALCDPMEHLHYAVDLCDYEKVDSIVQNAVKKLGKIDGLVNCAGISNTLPLRMIKPDKMDVLFRNNVNGAIQLTKYVTKSSNISTNGASIIFITSVMAIVGEVGKAFYGMTKGALLAAARSLAIELAPKKIRVNCISPGVVVTPMSMGSVYSKNKETLNRVKSLHPLGFGEPEDVANACIFLLSDEARWITGTDLIVDGGYTAR
jgi:NAD(P)-dependent dehydrogenase (short-subunit alcohol dehydrogenase family)